MRSLKRRSASSGSTSTEQRKANKAARAKRSGRSSGAEGPVWFCERWLGEQAARTKVIFQAKTEELKIVQKELKKEELKNVQACTPRVPALTDSTSGSEEEPATGSSQAAAASCLS